VNALYSAAATGFSSDCFRYKPRSFVLHNAIIPVIRNDDVNHTFRSDASRCHVRRM